MNFKHISILLEESIDGLNIKEDGIYVDGTLGGGGHSYEVAKRLGANGRLIGIDQDEDAIKAASERLREFSEKTIIVRDNYSNYKNIIEGHNIKKVNGILLDIGVSSYQLDNIERGFSYKYDTDLDMRMDQRQVVSAKTIVNEYSQKELFRIIKDYGEEQFAQNIAKHIVARRGEEEITTTGQLNEIIRAAIPAKLRMNGHPSKKTFQAIRIECNNELGVLKDTISDMIDSLEVGGRLCIITFHSLEDRIVKNAFKVIANPCTCPSSFPICVCGNVAKGRVITNKPIIPSEEEMEYNKRSKSAKLRIFERI